MVIEGSDSQQLHLSTEHKPKAAKRQRSIGDKPLYDDSKSMNQTATKKNVCMCLIFFRPSSLTCSNNEVRDN